jgi:hypothetical protein
LRVADVARVRVARLKGSRSDGFGSDAFGFDAFGGWLMEREAFSRAFSGLNRRLVAYSFKYSRSRRVCMRLTGISVDFSSFIRRM